MASWKPEIYNAEDVMRYYTESDCVMYKVYAGTKPEAAYLRYSFEESDQRAKHEGERLLRDALQAIMQNPMNTNPYLLEIIKKPKGKGRSEAARGVTTNITFQLNQPPSLLPYNGYTPHQPSNDALVKVMEKMVEQQNLIITKLSEEELPEDDPAEVAGVSQPNVMGVITNILNTPKVQEKLGDAIGDILSRVLGVSDNKKIGAIAGSTDEQSELIRKSLERLQAVEPNIAIHLSKLADVAEQQPQLFKMMLLQLNQM